MNEERMRNIADDDQFWGEVCNRCECTCDYEFMNEDERMNECEEVRIRTRLRDKRQRVVPLCLLTLVVVSF